MRALALLTVVAAVATASLHAGQAPSRSGAAPPQPAGAALPPRRRAVPRLRVSRHRRIDSLPPLRAVAMDAGHEAAAARHAARRHQREQLLSQQQRLRGERRAPRLPGGDADGLPAAAPALLRQPVSHRAAGRGRSGGGLDGGGKRTRRTGRAERHRPRHRGVQRGHVARVSPRPESVRLGCAPSGREVSGPICRARDQLGPDRVRRLPVRSAQGQGGDDGDSRRSGHLQPDRGVEEDGGRRQGRRRADTVYATVPGGTHLEAYLTYASPIFDFLDAHRK